MDILTILFWLLAFIVVYTYVGYGLLLYVIVRLRRVFGLGKKKSPAADFEPEVTLFITAYNEKDYVDAKMKNTLELDYPRSKLRILWVTDGSDDGTPEKVRSYAGAEVSHPVNQTMARFAKFFRCHKFLTNAISIA